ncbi:glycoside hydrolase family 9 protein [Natronobiforma cellulositropha]|uniref:glycoside hydrolase family 9 protein n=1 Tax=Natronobiforma cellulositropha TaxID=1679076 RepID=UPI0021D57426|nr:glycoside hydrolase family 9 protein [Natronobiforma cellulositropha]
MGRQRTVDRRTLLKATGGLAAMATLGSLGVGGVGAHEHDRAIRVNQVGYLPGATKVAVVIDDRVSGTAFEVVDSSGSVAYSGDLSAPVDDENSNRTVRHADFTALEDEGEYVVEVGGESSFPFEIGDDVYVDPLRKAGRLYTLKRVGVDMDDPETGLSFQAGHQQDAEAEVVAWDDPEYDQGETVDVTGGWYDAGDYSKYTAPSAITLGAKMWAYERNPGAFEDLDYNFPPGISEEDSGRMPDVLAEIKWKLEWFQKAQRRDGAMWFIVAGTNWAPFAPPAQDTQQRYVFGLSSAGTAMACANFAQAARLFEAYDADFAAEMLACAEDAYAWLQDNPEMVWRVDPQQDAGSGPYHRGPEFEDPNRFEEDGMSDPSIDGYAMEEFDRFWAAAELLKTTGDSSYNDDLEADLAHVFTQEPIDFDWYNGLVLGQYAYYTADAGDPARQDDVADAILSWADTRLEHVQQDGFENALVERDYHWASAQKGASFGVMFMLANAIEPNPDYVDAGLAQLHHVLGRSATGYSYVTRVGSYYPENPHDRLVDGTGTLLPGMVVGGPNWGDQWPEMGMSFNEAPYDDPGVAHLYVDEQARYDVNEWAINYTAPVFWLLAEATTLDTDGSDDPVDPVELDVNGDGNPAQDLTGDGLYEDITGDGNLGFNDVVTFFEEHNGDVVQNNVSSFDFSGSGSVGFNDVVSLFEML